MSDDSNDLYTPAQYREHQDGHMQRDPREVNSHSGIVRDKQLSRFLSVLEESYDPTRCERPEMMPGQSKDLDFVESMVRIEGTETGRKAMDSGDMQSLRHLTGDTTQRADVSGIKAMNALRSEVDATVPIFYIYGKMGEGKSNFSLLIGQLWKDQKPSDAVVGSNIKSLQESDEWVDRDGNVRDGWIANYGELEEWLKQDGDPLRNDQRPKLFIFDEASSHAGGGGSDGYETKTQLGPLTYKIRKYGGALIVIGHDGKDVHPLIRELGTVIHKESIKDATFYEDVKRRQGVNEIMSITGVPETDWRYDDEEPTDWSWSSSDSDDDGDIHDVDPKRLTRKIAIDAVIRGKERGHTNSEIAEFVPYSAEWVRRRWNEYEDKNQHENVVGEVAELTA